MGGHGVDVVLGYAFPAELARTLREARPDLTPADAERVLEGLRDFLAACALARPASATPLAMPSTVADEAWQQFILLTGDYLDFCREAYDGYLHRDVVSVAGADGALDRTDAAVASLSEARVGGGGLPGGPGPGSTLLVLDSLVRASASAGGVETVAVATVVGRAPALPKPTEGPRWQAAALVGLVAWVGLGLWSTTLVPPEQGWLSIGAVVLLPLGAGVLTVRLIPVIRHAQRVRTITQDPFPAQVSAEVERRYPHLTADDVEGALEGLRQYFLACLGNLEAGSRLPVGMPSRVVDDAWHAFVLQTRSYELWCRRAFGTYLHHTPRGELQVPMVDALANTVRRLRSMPTWDGVGVFGRPGRHRRRDVAPVAAGVATLPALFLIDAALGITDGYTFDASSVAEITSRSFELERLGELGAVEGAGEGASRWDVLFGGGGGCGGGCGGGG